MEQCVFCRIVKGELSCRKIYENARTLAFLDIAGDVDGHILVIPKKHASDLFDYDTETLKQVTETVKTVADHLKHSCGYEGVNLLHASGACAGQSVGHFHLHLIPRKPTDGIDAWPHFPGAKEPLEHVWEKLEKRDEQ